MEEARPFDEQSFVEYLWWYVPRTCTWVTFTPESVRPHIASTTEAYPVHWDEDAALAVSFPLKSVVHTQQTKPYTVIVYFCSYPQADIIYDVLPP